LITLLLDSFSGRAQERKAKVGQNILFVHRLGIPSTKQSEITICIPLSVLLCWFTGKNPIHRYPQSSLSQLWDIIWVFSERDNQLKLYLQLD
jgi:hypothetical protein